MARGWWIVGTSLVLGGCVEPLPDDLAARLTRTGGCGDVVFFATDADDTLMLIAEAPELVTEAFAAGQTRTTDYLIPDESFSLQVHRGARVSDATCDDVVEQGGPDIRDTWTAEAGSATITIVPGPTAEQSTGTLLIQDVIVDDALIATFEIADVAVGWFAG